MLPRREQASGRRLHQGKGQCWISIFDIANLENHSLRLANGLGRSYSSSSNSPSSWSRRSNVARSSYSSWTSRCRVAMTGSASRPNRTEKEIRFSERKIPPDGFGSTSTRPGRNLTRTFPKTEPKFGLQNLPNREVLQYVITCHNTYVICHRALRQVLVLQHFAALWLDVKPKYPGCGLAPSSKQRKVCASHPRAPKSKR